MSDTPRPAAFPVSVIEVRAWAIAQVWRTPTNLWSPQGAAALVASASVFEAYLLHGAAWMAAATIPPEPPPSDIPDFEMPPAYPDPEPTQRERDEVTRPYREALAELRRLVVAPGVPVEFRAEVRRLLEDPFQLFVLVPETRTAEGTRRSGERYKPSDTLLEALAAARALELEKLRLVGHRSSPVGCGNATEEAGGAAVKAAPPDAAPTAPGGGTCGMTMSDMPAVSSDTVPRATTAPNADQEPASGSAATS